MTQNYKGGYAQAIRDFDKLLQYIEGNNKLGSKKKYQTMFYSLLKVLTQNYEAREGLMQGKYKNFQVSEVTFESYYLPML